MRILLLNPPHNAIGSRIPVEHLPPFGLLCLGGPLLDAHHQVRLFDAEFGPASTADILSHVHAYKPDAILIGHSGSTSAHPVVVAITRAIRRAHLGIWIIYGGVFPTFHWRDIMERETQIDIIVRGEGEETIVRLVNALETGTPLGEVPGIVYRAANTHHPDEPGMAMATVSARIIENLDRHRVGWELIDHT